MQIFTFLTLWLLASGQLLGVIAIGVPLPDQEVSLARGGEELLAWQSEGNRECPAESSTGDVLIPRAHREGSWAEHLGKDSF